MGIGHHTYTCCAINIKLIARITRTEVASICVGAQVRAVSIGNGAFIDVLYPNEADGSTVKSTVQAYRCM